MRPWLLAVAWCRWMAMVSQAKAAAAAASGLVAGRGGRTMKALNREVDERVGRLEHRRGGFP